MKFKELKPLKEKELNEKLNELKRELLKDKTEAAKGSQVKNRSKIGTDALSSYSLTTPPRSLNSNTDFKSCRTNPTGRL